MNSGMNHILFGQNVRSQSLRFVMSGGLLTVGAAFLYWVLSEFAGISPYVAMTIAYGVATIIGFQLHGRFSFNGHGGRDRVGVRSLRYLVACAVGYASNQFFVWLLTSKLGGPTWWPVIPVIIVTPVLTFFLNRNWVFK